VQNVASRQALPTGRHVNGELRFCHVFARRKNAAALASVRRRNRAVPQAAATYNVEGALLSSRSVRRSSSA
jgi:hypothetical protein